MPEAEEPAGPAEPAASSEPSGAARPAGSAAPVEPSERVEDGPSRSVDGEPSQSVDGEPSKGVDGEPSKGVEDAPSEGVEDGPRRDQWRPVRRTVAQVTIAFTVLFLVPLIRLVAGQDEPKVERDAAAWVVWIASLAVMVASALIAVQALRTTDRATEVRLTWWCGGLWIAGFVLTTIYSSLVN